MEDVFDVFIALGPIFVFFLLFISTRKSKLVKRSIFLFASVIVSLPIFGFSVTVVDGLNIAGAGDHNPGVGVAFVPLLIGWLAALIASVVTFLFLAVSVVMGSRRGRTKSHAK
jgi:formate hydrogenlyase subunit 3/multisubunit Na+/H+ antiporter MnhD subunit